MSKIIELSNDRLNGAYIKIADNGAYSVHKPTPRQGGELFCGFRPMMCDTESLQRALKYVGASKTETARAIKHFE